MKINRNVVGGSITSLAVLAATSGRIYMGGILMALGFGVLYPGRKNDQEDISK